MDERPPQFTLRNLLIEVTLIAVTLGVGRVVFFVYEYEDRGDPRILLSLVAILALPALCGAIVGGITGQYVKGAVWGTVTAGVLLLIASLFMPAVQAGELDWGPSWVNASSLPTLNLQTHFPLTETCRPGIALPHRQIVPVRRTLLRGHHRRVARERAPFDRRDGLQHGSRDEQFGSVC